MKFCKVEFAKSDVQKCIISPIDHTDIARIGFAPKIVENQEKFILETKIRS